MISSTFSRAGGTTARQLAVRTAVGAAGLLGVAAGVYGLTRVNWGDAFEPAPAKPGPPECSIPPWSITPEKFPECDSTK